MLFKRVVNSLKGLLSKDDRPFLTAISFGMPAFLLIVLVGKIVWGTLLGVSPAPQIPPNGYTAAEDRVHIYWRRGRHKGDFEVQVAADCDFSRPLFTRKTDRTDLVLPRLEAGKSYCWRVLNNGGALVSRFKTARTFVPY